MGGWIAVIRRGWELEPSLLNMRPALPPQRDRRTRARARARARALGMPAARLPTWPGCAWQAPARHRSGAPEAQFARCWLSPRRRFHVMLAVAGAETTRKCASSQLLMDLRREPSPPISSTAGPTRPSGASFKRAV